jgi:hypothetical protein
MEEIIAYQTIDGKKFLDAKEAAEHENEIRSVERFAEHMEQIGNYVHECFHVTKYDDDDSEPKCIVEDFCIEMGAEDLNELIDKVSEIHESDLHLPLERLIDLAHIIAKSFDGNLLGLANFIWSIKHGESPRT